MKKYFILFNLILFSLYSYANHAKLDSLEQLYKNASSDSLKLVHFKSIASYYVFHGSPLKADSMYLLGIQGCEQLNLTHLKYAFISNRGVVYKQMGKLDSALAFFQEPISYFKEFKNYPAVANNFYNMAILNFYKRDINSTLAFADSSSYYAQLGEDLKLQIAALEMKINVAIQFNQVNDSFLSASSSVIFNYKKLKDESKMLMAMCNHATLLNRINRNEDAIKFILKTIGLADSLEYKVMLGNAYNIAGTLQAQNGLQKNALGYFIKAKTAFENGNRMLELFDVYKKIFTIYSDYGKHSKYSEGEYDSIINLGAELDALNNNTQLKYYYLNAKMSQSFGMLNSSKYHSDNLDDALLVAEKVLREARQLIPFSPIKKTNENFNRLACQYYFYKKDWDNCIKTSEFFFDYVLKETKDTRRFNEAIGLSRFLYTSHEALGNLPKALKFSLLLKSYTDSLNDHKQAEEISLITAKYEKESVIKENSILKAETEAAKSKNQFWISLGVAGLIIGVISLLYFTQRRKRIANQLVIEKQYFTEQMQEQENKNLESILNALENERERISKDIHDRIGAGISTAKLYFKGIEKLMEKSDQKLDENFSKVNEVLDSSISEVRKISHNMSAGVLSDFGLKTALKELKETVEGTGEITFRLVLDGLNERLDSRVEINLYRIVQELVNNTIKHAEAKKIYLSMVQNDKVIVCEYSDNGISFDLNLVKKGMGIRNIKNRVASLNAKIEFKGSQVFLNIPI